MLLTLTEQEINSRVVVQTGKFVFCFVFIYLFTFVFLGPHPRHVEVPRVGVKWEL